MKKYKRALANNNKLKKLYKEKFGSGGMTNEKLANFKGALQFVVNQNENTGQYSIYVTNYDCSTNFVLFPALDCIVKY